MKRLFFALTLTASTLAFAAEDIRIDLAAKTGLICNSVSKGVTGSPARWMKERQDQRLLITAKSGPEWKKHTFTFTPKADGQVEFIIMGNQRNRDVCYDNVTIKGAELKNGDFEEMNSKSLPQNWRLRQEELRSGDAASGKYYVQTNHDKRATQIITVKGGQPVEISFMATAAR